MDLRALLPAFAKHLVARGAAVRTLESYERTLGTFFDALGRRAPQRGDVEAFLARPRRDGQARAASTKRAELMALRAFFRFAAREAALTDPTDGLAVKRERRPDPPVAMPEDIAPLFTAATCSATRHRDTAILGLLCVLGLRVHEVAALDTAQFDLAACALRRVRGKGGTVTDFPLPSALVALLSNWLRQRAMLGHDVAAGPLFPTARPSSSTTGRLSIRSLQRLVERLAEDAGLGRRLGPHALRHGCATAAISLGVDVPTTAEVLRHASIATTQAYVHLARDARREALERIASLIPPSVVPVMPPAPERKHIENHPKIGGQSAVDIQPLMYDVRKVRESAPSPETSQKSFASPPALPPGAGFVPDGRSRALSSEREVGRGERERENGEDRRADVARFTCGGCACRARWRREWYAWRRARAVVR